MDFGRGKLSAVWLSVSLSRVSTGLDFQVPGMVVVFVPRRCKSAAGWQSHFL